MIGARLRKRAQQPAYRRLANEFGDWGIAWGTGYQIADSQSGQRYYPAAVCALDDVPGEDFVFEAQILISAARAARHALRVGADRIALPRPCSPAEQFRASHFRPLRDFSRITCHIVLQAVRRGGMLAVYRSIRANPPVIDDPSGEFGTAFATHAAAACDARIEHARRQPTSSSSAAASPA